MNSLKNLLENEKNILNIAKSDRTQICKEIKENYKEYAEKNVLIIGNIIAKRTMGKASFCLIQDSTDKIQCYVSVNDIGFEDYEIFKKVNLGDIVKIQGIALKNNTGEIIIYIKEFAKI